MKDLRRYLRLLPQLFQPQSGKLFISFLAALMFVAGFTINANAADFTVTNLNDSGAGSLRQAILDANAAAGDDAIIFQSGLTGTISLTSGELLINSDLTITAPGSSQLTVARDSQASVNFRIFNIAESATVAISGITITGGRLTTVSNGTAIAGGILNAGTLNLTDVVVTGNSLIPSTPSVDFTNTSGGGIYNTNTGSLTLLDSVVSNNIATGDINNQGGGIYSVGNLTVTSSSITGNKVTSNTAGATNSGCGCGGGVYATGTFILTNATVSGNSTIGRLGRGGGIYSSGNLTLINSSVGSNTSASGSNSDAAGGGIEAVGSLSLIDSSVSSNSATSQTTSRGGGVSLGSGTYSFTNSTIASNLATAPMGASGGGIYGGVALTLTNSEVLGNRVTSTNGITSGGGINSGGIMTLTNSTVSDNTASSSNSFSSGGGINGSGTLQSVTISGNRVVGSTGAHGGGINMSASLTLTNSTVSGNSATSTSSAGSNGGGIYAFNGTTDLKSSTIAFNSVIGTTGSTTQRGGGIARNTGTVNVYNTIIAQNTLSAAASPTVSGPDANGAIVSQGHNLIGNTAGSSGWIGSDSINQNAFLAPLANYGGLTQTHALEPNSPAINAGDNSNAPATDQRGAARIVSGTIDIGAFENSVIITPETLPAPVFGEPYNQVLSAQRLTNLADESLSSSNQDSLNQLPPFVFSLVSGSLPNGMTLSADGTISGTPTVGGSYNFTVKATDADGIAGARSYSLNIPCDFSLGATSQEFPASGGSGSFTVNATPGCGWTAVSDVSWISITLGNSGTGGGTVQFMVQNNPGPSRSGTITVAGQTFTITQPSGCVYTLTASSANFPVGGGSGNFNVTTGAGCPWMASTDASWINITSGSGAGNGQVAFTVAANTGAPRSGIIMVGSLSFTVNQAPLCSYSLSFSGTNFPASGGSGSFNVTTYAGCQWSASTNTPWITINSGSGSDNGSVTYTVHPNAQPARTGTINVNGQTFTIEQASGCSFTLTSTSMSVPARGGSGSFTVNSGAGCTWTAVSNVSWIDITSGAGGNGSGNVTFSIEVNSGRKRTGTITAGGQTFTINQGAKPYFDFDGDGKTDIGVWRAPSGSWWYLHSSDLSGHGHSFGLPDDIITPGDFTGDGKTDVAIWRPTTGEWFVRRSEDGSYFAYQFGLPGDIPAPGDYDGDGITDTATFRPSTATWYIFLSSTGGFGIVTFGLDGDKPVVADYDGDGKADIAVWRPSNGTWWIVRSSDLVQQGFGFGTGTDKPVPGDYTGDGKADIAVWRDSTREWFFLRSEDGSYYSYPSGLPGDIPAPGDYDGDGRFDSAVFRPSTQTWYIDGSTAGSMIATFGLSGDRPVPNAFVP